MAVYAARQSSFTTGDTITAAHSNNEFNAILAAFHVSTGHTHDGTTAGDGGPLSTLYSNTISMGTGADTDIAVTFNANSNDGVITWMEDEDYFQFSDDILLSTTEKVQFRDTAIYINSSTDGQLDLVADTEIQIAATTVDINGNVDVSGTLSLAGTAITSTAAELNILDGVTSTAAELNILDGVTSTAAELNILDGVTSTTAELNILDGVTSTAAELNILDGVTSTTAELNILDGVTSTAAELNILDGVTSTTAELNILDGVTSTAAELNILDGVTATATEINIIDGNTSATSTTVADADRVVYNDDGTMKQVAVTDLDTYISATSKTLTNKTLTSPVLNTGVSGTAILDEDDMSSNSATKLATQQSIKAYVDSEVGGVSSSWVLEDDDGTEVTVAAGKEVKFIGSGLTTNWTDTDNGTDADPYDMTFTVDAAQTGITSILATDLKIGEDNETKIDFETADEIHFYAANAEQVYVADGVFGPQTDSDVDLGTTGVRWKDAYVDSVAITNNLTVGGDLTVNGTTTTVNSTTVTIDDPIFTLGGDSAPGSDDNKDRGIEFRWHSGTAAKVGFFGYDDSAEVFTFIPDASNSSEVFSGTAGNVAFGNIAGTLTTAAQTNITSVGALDGGSISSGFGAIDTGSSNITTTGLISGGSLDIDNVLINGTTIGHTDDTDLMTLSNGGLVVAGTLEATGNITGTLATAAQTNITSLGTLTALTIDNVTIDGATIGHTSDTDLMTLASGGLTVAGTIEGTTITASTAVVPDASGGADLGSTSLEWGDVYIADDKKLYLGSDQNFSIEYDEDGNDTTAVVAAGGVSMAPHGSSAGNGTELRFQELAANGANYVGFKAPDSIAANKVFVLPNADGNAGQFLKTDGSLALSWADAGGGGTADLVADGAITAGKPVILTAAGKAQQVGYVDSTTVVSSNGSAGAQERGTNAVTRLSTVYDTNSDRFVTAYADDGNSGYGTAVVHLLSNTTTGAITYGTPVVFESADVDLQSHGTRYIAFDSTANRVVIAYRDMGDSNKGKAVVGSVTAGTNAISFGTAVEFEAGNTQFINTVYDSNVDRTAIFYLDSGDSDKGKGIVGTVTAGTNAIAFGTASSFHADTTANIAAAFEPDTNKILVCYDDRAGGNTGEAKVATVTGGTTNSIAYGSATAWVSNGGTPSNISMDYDTTLNKFVTSFTDEGNSSYASAVVGTISGTSVSFGSVAVLGTHSTGDTVTIFDPDLEKTVVSVMDTSNNKRIVYHVGVSGTTPSVQGTLEVASSNDPSGGLSMAYDPDNDKMVVMFEDDDDHLNGMMINATLGTNLTTSNFIGIAAASISDTATGKITIDGGINENQTSLTIGTNYFATDSGTIATTGTQLIGRAIAADKIQVGVKTGTVAHNAVALDANAKLPAVDGSQLTGVLGPMTMTVKTGADTITAGQPVAYSMGGTDVRCEPVHMISSDGTYGGLSSSYEIHDWDANSRTYGPAMQIGVTKASTCLVYDPDTNRMVFVYQNKTASEMQYQVGTVTSSGSSMSWGTPAKVLGHADDNSGNDDTLGSSPYYTLVYDTHRNKVVMPFRDYNNSQVISAVVGTVTGGTTNTIAWGSRVALDTTDRSPDFFDATFDSNVNKTVVAFCDVNDNEYGKYVHITVSDTGVPSFGTLTTFHSARTEQIAIEHHADSGYNCVFFIDYPNSSYSKIHTAKINSSTGAFTTGESESTFYYSSIGYHSLHYHAPSTSMIAAYTENSNQRVRAKPFSVSSTGGISNGNDLVVDTSTTFSYRTPQLVTDTVTGKVQYAYFQQQSSNHNWARRNLMVSGTQISLDSGTEVQFQNYQYYGYDARFAYNETEQRNVMVYAGQDGTSDKTANHWSMAKIRKDNNTHRYIGIAQNTAAAGEECKITTFGQLATNCTDLLSNGLSSTDQKYPRKLWFNGTSSSANVQFNGTFSINNDNPNNVAGVALNSSTILVAFDTTYGIGYDHQTGTYDYLIKQPT